MGGGFEDQKAEPIASERRLSTKVRVGPAGRVVIPAEIRSALNIKEGDVLLAQLVDSELRLVTLDTAIRRTQELVRQAIPQGTKLVDAFLRERRSSWGEDE